MVTTYMSQWTSAELPLEHLDEYPRHEAGTDADGDVVGEWHEDDREQSG